MLPTKRALLVAFAVTVLGAGCATTSGTAGSSSIRPASESDQSTAERLAATRTATTTAPVAASETAPAAKSTPPPDSGEPPATTPALSTAAEVRAPRRLAWVNPSRCVSSCAFHPGEALVRVNERGAADPRGLFQVEAAALTGLRNMLAAARAAGHVVKIASAFRPYAEQVRLFRTTKEKGRAARPGHSEHQLGTTIDLRLPTTRAIEWLADHAVAHGFVLSYPSGKQRVTGYRPEPWHVRFVGRDIAAQIPAGGTLEELFRRHPELAESGDCADCPAPVSRATCGRLTTAGTCDGTVLSWCFDGARAAVDCAAFNQICASAGDVPDCVPVETAAR